MSPQNKPSARKLPLTASVEEGPYYKTGSPERQVISGPNTFGSKFIVTGSVHDRNGRPVPGAWLDFWHADGNGQYDNAGYNLRGHQYTGSDGRFYLETVRPFGYQSRAAHVHAKIRATASSPILTTQLFFPGDEKNATDPIFEKLTVMDIKNTNDGQKATFDFVVET
jgi:protocatechuate 3,4-dioxygenase beta subunit